MIQVDECMQSNDLDEVNQSAYKNRYSTETALLKVTNDIALALGENKAAFLIMLDLNAAFDTIDHIFIGLNMALVSKAVPLNGSVPTYLVASSECL